MFSTSTPVTAEHFHNRSAELAMIEGALRQLQAGAPSWMAIIGPRKVGKTSLVLEAARLAATPALRVTTIDVQEITPVSMEFFRLYALRVLDSAFELELGESLERLAHVPSRFRRLLQKAPNFGNLTEDLRAELLEIADGQVDPGRVGRWLKLPELLGEALELRFVVAIDEYQLLDALTRARAGIDLFTLMRSVWQKHKRVAYIISGSARSMLLSLVTAEHSPFFQHFTIVDLGPFEHEEAVTLLEQQSPPDRPISRDLALRAVELIGGHPFYLQMLGETMTEQRTAPDLGDLKAACQRLLFSRTGRLGLYFENEYQRLVGRSGTLAAALSALATGPIRLADISARIKTTSGAAVSYLERLKDAARKCEDGRYELSDPTFGLWLRWREPGGTVVPMSVVGDRAEQAVAQELAAMGFDLVYQSRASRGAFDLLATRGAKQLGVQAKRSALPLRFSRTAWSRMEAEALRLGWMWIIAAIDRDDRVTMLDPAHAMIGKEVRVRASATIKNLLLWFNQGAANRK